MTGLKSKNTVACAAPVSGPVNRFRSRIAALLVIITASLVGVVSPASASTPDPDLTGGAGSTFFDSITNYVQGPLGIATLTLFAIVVGFALVMKWGGKVAKK